MFAGTQMGYASPPEIRQIRMDLQRRHGAAPRSRWFFTKRAKVAVRVHAPRAANNERNELTPLHWSPHQCGKTGRRKMSGQDHHRMAILHRNAPSYPMSGRGLKARPIGRLPPYSPCHGPVSESLHTTGRTRTECRRRSSKLLQTAHERFHQD